MQFINARYLFYSGCVLPKLFTQFKCQIPFLYVVIKGAYLQFIAPCFITLNPLVLFRVVESLNHCVAFDTLKTLRTSIPPDVVL